MSLVAESVSSVVRVRFGMVNHSFYKWTIRMEITRTGLKIMYVQYVLIAILS